MNTAYQRSNNSSMAYNRSNGNTWGTREQRIEEGNLNLVSYLMF